MSVINPWTSPCPIRDELSSILAEVLGVDYRFVDMRPEEIQTLQPAPGMSPVEGCRTVVFGLRTCYLLDTMRLTEKTCRRLGQRFVHSQHLTDLRVLHELSQQTTLVFSAKAFKLSMGILMARYASEDDVDDAGTDGTDDTAPHQEIVELWINIGVPEMTATAGMDGDLPDHVLQLALDILDQIGQPINTGYVHLILDRPETMNDFIAGISEFPVIYFAGPDGRIAMSLEDKVFSTVRVWLTWQGTRLVELLSFNYPNAIKTQSRPIDRFLRRLPRTLVAKYTNRIVDAASRGVLPTRGLAVEVSVDEFVYGEDHNDVRVTSQA